MVMHFWGVSGCAMYPTPRIGLSVRSSETKFAASYSHRYISGSRTRFKVMSIIQNVQLRHMLHHTYVKVSRDLEYLIFF